MSYQFPVAEVVDSLVAGEVLKTTLRIDRPLSPPAAPASLTARDDPRRVVLTLHRAVQRDGEHITFETDDPAAPPLPVGAQYSFQQWWAPYQLEVAQSPRGRWRRETFSAQDATSYASGGFTVSTKGSPASRLRIEPGDGGLTIHLEPADASEPEQERGEGPAPTIVPGGWDHEHCALCWRTISQAEGDDPAGYTDGQDWICETCFGAYIASGFGPTLGDRT